jgi:universal stress protein E
MTKILAVIDPRESSHHALERCRQQPPESNLDIHAVLFVEHDSAEHFAKLYKEKSKWLREQVTPYIADGYRVTSEVVPFKNLYQSVIDIAKAQAVDFVVKPMRQHSMFQTVLRTSTDWHLIRHCPYPLLLVSELDDIRGKPVLAAVDVCTGDENHETLNDVVLKQSLRLATVLGSDVHVMNSFKCPAPVAAVGTIDPTPYATSSDLRKEHAIAIKKFLGDANVAATHVEEGATAFAINSIARQVSAGVIVIGTVARTGISGALVGNTAEGVLESANCDVLVVKLPA